MLHLGSHTTKALDHMWLFHQCSLLGKLGSCRHPSWRNLGGCNDKSMGTVCTKFLSFKMPASSKFHGKFLRRFLRHEARLKLCNNTVRTFLAKLGLLACLCPSCFSFSYHLQGQQCYKHILQENSRHALVSDCEASSLSKAIYMNAKQH